MALKKIGTQIAIADISTSHEDLIAERKTEAKVLEPKHKDFLYFRGRAISAGDQGPKQKEPNPNGNGDYFPRKELESSYETFIGKNLFLNHESEHPIKSVGKIVDTYPVEDPETGEFYVECLAKIDRKLHPEIARKIETGELDKTSMGCSCESSTCSICGKVLYSDSDDKCAHLSPTGLLKNYEAEVNFPEYGIEKGKPAKAFAINKGLTFNEWSIVNVPADSQAVIKTVLANAKKQLSKIASLTKEEQLDIVSQVEKILNQLDEDTKTKVKSEICACVMPKEDLNMSDKAKSKSSEIKDEQSIEKTVTNGTEEEVNEILKKLSGYELKRLEDSLEKKMKKEAKVEKVEEPKKEVLQEKETSDPKEESTILEKVNKVIEKVKDSLAAKFLSHTIKRIAEEEMLPKEETPKEEKVEEPKINAKFNTNEDISKATWTIYEGEKQLLQATLKDIWADQLDDALKTEKDWIVGIEKDADGLTYGDALIARFKTDGIEKTSKLLGIAFEVMDVKDSKVETPKKSDFVKPGEETKADKEADKSVKALEKVEEESKVGDHLEESIPGKEKKEASLDKKVAERAPKAWWDMMMEDLKKQYPGKSDEELGKILGGIWSNYSESEQSGILEKYSTVEKENCVEEKEADVEDAQNALPIEEALPETSPTMEKQLEEPPKEEKVEEVVEKLPEENSESTFDKLKDKIEIGDGFSAIKDFETNEIIVSDAEGKEVKRLPDGFGDDIVDVMKLLQEIMGIKPTEEPKVKEVVEEKPEMKIEEVEEKPEMKIEEVVEEEPVVVSKEEQDLAKKAEELKKKEEVLLEREKQLQAAKFSTAINNRMSRCQRIVEAMFERDMLKLDEKIVEAEVDKGEEMLKAREVALTSAVNNQIKTLMSMDDKSLKAFEEGVHSTNVKKVASKKKLATPINLGYEEHSEEKVISSIFKSMGTLKNK